MHNSLRSYRHLDATVLFNVMISVFSILAIIAVFGFSLRLLYYYASRSTPWHIYALVFIAWTMAFGIIALLPYDVYLVQPT